MNEEIENLDIEVSVLREKNRILTLRLDNLTSQVKRHMGVHNP